MQNSYKNPKKIKIISVSHELRTCESSFSHCFCEHNSPGFRAKFFLWTAYGQTSKFLLECLLNNV